MELVYNEVPFDEMFYSILVLIILYFIYLMRKVYPYNRIYVFLLFIFLYSIFKYIFRKKM